MIILPGGNRQTSGASTKHGNVTGPVLGGAALRGGVTAVGGVYANGEE